MTADELLRLPRDEWRYELVRGHLKKVPRSGAFHGRVAANLIASLVNHVKRNRLGAVYASETGFQIETNPDTVLAPAVAFVRAERAVDRSGFFEGLPDAAFELDSSKEAAWIHAGTHAVVIADPRTKSIRVHRAAGAVSVADTVEIDDVIPGWRISLADVFD